MKNTKLEFWRYSKLIDTIECIDFIPYTGDVITIKNKTYTVLNREFDYDNNVIIILIR